MGLASNADAEKESHIPEQKMSLEPEGQRIKRFSPVVDVLARIDAQVHPVVPHAADVASAAGLTLAEDAAAQIHPLAECLNFSTQLYLASQEFTTISRRAWLLSRCYP